ncbi:hypothetical protein DV736_g2849, partial [Chaetothyriales sp. CBS 134916]
MTQIRSLTFAAAVYVDKRLSLNFQQSHFRSPKKGRKGRKVKKQPASKAKNYVDEFFSGFHYFDYDSSAPVWEEFNRMCGEFDWTSDDYEMRVARREFKSAMVEQFNAVYGTSEEDLSAWENICRILNIDPPPTSLKGCRAVVRRTHVNLVDLVDYSRTGEAVQVFPTVAALRDYTKETKKFFPKEDAKSGGLLRFLLREIIQ